MVGSRISTNKNFALKEDWPKGQEATITTTTTTTTKQTKTKQCQDLGLEGKGCGKFEPSLPPIPSTL